MGAAASSGLQAYMVLPVVLAASHIRGTLHAACYCNRTSLHVSMCWQHAEVLLCIVQPADALNFNAG